MYVRKFIKCLIYIHTRTQCSILIYKCLYTPETAHMYGPKTGIISYINDNFTYIDSHEFLWYLFQIKHCEEK